MRIAATYARKNKLDENVARPKDQIGRRIWDALSCSMAIQSAEPGPGARAPDPGPRIPGPPPTRAPPCFSLLRLIAAPTAHPVYTMVHTYVFGSERACNL